MDTNTQTTVMEAEGYLELGMPDEAWKTLDGLGSSDQRRASVLGLRARILIATKAWVKAEILAGSIVTAMPRFALAWYTLAQAFAQQGKIGPAKTALQCACVRDDKFREMALEDDLLAQIW